MKKYLVGIVTLDQDREMTNTSFSYAADYETILVKAGSYPIYVYDDDLKKYDDEIIVESVRIGYNGIVLESNVGNKPGTNSEYHRYRYGYDMAAAFLRGHDDYNREKWYDVHYIIGAAFTVCVHDFISYDGERILCLQLVRKDGTDLIEMEEQL